MNHALQPSLSTVASPWNTSHIANHHRSSTSTQWYWLSRSRRPHCGAVFVAALKSSVIKPLWQGYFSGGAHPSPQKKKKQCAQPSPARHPMPAPTRLTAAIVQAQSVGVHYRDATFVAPVLALHILSGPRLKVCAGGPLTLVSLLRHT